MLSGHKELSNIEVRRKGTGGEKESQIFLCFCHNLIAKTIKMEDANIKNHVYTHPSVEQKL